MEWNEEESYWLRVLAWIERDPLQRNRSGSNRGLGTLLELVRECREELPPLDDLAKLRGYWSLHRAGILAPGVDLLNRDPAGFAHVTPLGREVLRDLDAAPENPSGFVAALALEPRSPEASYLEEALTCLRADAPRASIILTGVVAEIHVRKVAAALLASSQPTLTSNQSKRLESFQVAHVISAVDDMIRSGQVRPPIAGALREAFDRLWASAADVIRFGRNEQGHAVGVGRPARDEARGHLLLLKPFVRLTRELVMHFGGHP